MRRMRVAVTRAPVGPFSHVSRLCAAAGSRPSSVSAPLAHARVGSSTAPLTLPSPSEFLAGTVTVRAGARQTASGATLSAVLVLCCAAPVHLSLCGCLILHWPLRPMSKVGVHILEYFAHKVHAYMSCIILHYFAYFCR